MSPISLSLQVDSARAESATLRSEVEGLRRSADDSREAEANRRDIENMRGEIVMISKTFSDFVRRYRQVVTKLITGLYRVTLAGNCSGRSGRLWTL